MQRNNIYIDDFAIKQVTKRNVENQESKGPKHTQFHFPEFKANLRRDFSYRAYRWFSSDLLSVANCKSPARKDE